LQNSPFLLWQKGLKQLRRPRFVASLHGDTLVAQAAFAKIDHPLETRQIHFKIVFKDGRH